MQCPCILLFSGRIARIYLAGTSESKNRALAFDSGESIGRHFTCSTTAVRDLHRGSLSRGQVREHINISSYENVAL